jgi:drug/metabolite transporter (DMT)-like permease
MHLASFLSIRTLLGVLIGTLGVLLITTSVVGVVDAAKQNANGRRVAALSGISLPLLTGLVAARVERGTLVEPMRRRA